MPFLLGVPTSPKLISPSGELILIVGLEQVKLRVNPITMLDAFKDSPLSQSIILEYQNAKPGTIPEVNLPDEDAAAFQAVCEVLHNIPLATGCTASSLLKMAVISSKHKLNKAMTRFCHLVVYLMAEPLFVQPPSERMRHTATLTAAAYLFENKQDFETLTGSLVLLHDRSFHELLKYAVIDGYVPASLPVLLTEKRTSAKRSIKAILRSQMNSQCTCGCYAVCESMLEDISAEMRQPDGSRVPTLLSTLHRLQGVPYDSIVGEEADGQLCKWKDEGSILACLPYRIEEIQDALGVDADEMKTLKEAF